MIARALFVDNGAAAGLAKFNSQVHEVASAAPGGVRGFNMMERGLQTLAAEAIGVQGPIGKIAEGLLKFSGGSGLVLGAAAGIGVVALAYRLWTADARAAEKAQEDFLKALEKTPQGAAVAARINLGTQQDKLAELQAEEARTAQRGDPTVGIAVRVEAQRRAVAEATIQAAAAERAVTAAQDASIASATRNAQVMQETVAIREHANAVGQDEAQTLEQIAIVTAEATAAAQHMDDAHTAALITQSIRLARFTEENRVLVEQRDLLDEIGRISSGVSADMARFLATPGAEAGLMGIRAPSFQQLQNQEAGRQIGLQADALTKQASQWAFTMGPQIIDDMNVGIDKALQDTSGFKNGGVQMAAAFVGAVGQFSQGGAGNVLGGLGTLASGASQVSAFKSASGTLSTVGFALTAVGSVFSLFDHSAERRHEEQMRALEELHRIRENTDHRGQPDHVSVTVLLNGKEVSASILGDVIYGIRRMERTNAVPVLPP